MGSRGSTGVFVVYAAEDADQPWVCEVNEAVERDPRIALVPVASADAVVLCLSEQFWASRRCRWILTKSALYSRLRRGTRWVVYVLDPSSPPSHLLRDGLDPDARRWIPTEVFPFEIEDVQQEVPDVDAIDIPERSIGVADEFDFPDPIRDEEFGGEDADELNLPSDIGQAESQGQSTRDRLRDQASAPGDDPHWETRPTAPPPPPLLPPPPETSTPLLDRFEVAVFAQPIVEQERPFLLEMFAFRTEDRDEAVGRAWRSFEHEELGSKGLIRAPRGGYITTRLEFLSPGWLIEPPEDEFAWTGSVTNVQFVVTPSKSVLPGVHVGRIMLLADGLQRGSVSFQIRVGVPVPGEPAAAELQSTAQIIQSAFASYSSQDQQRVYTRVQGIQAAGVEVFLDLVTLRSGAWRPQLEEKIRTADVFFLFWSQRARDSVEVEREWRLALAEKGLEFIKPVPLDPPNVAPPPPELKSLHFNDLYLALGSIGAQQGDA